MLMSNEVITVYEDVQCKLYLTEKQKMDILNLKALWGNQNLLLQADGTILMKHYVGFAVSGDTRIQILPKIYSGHSENKENEAAEACELLVRLLSYSGYLSVKDIPKPQEIEGCKADLLEIFITIFIDKFLSFFSSDAHRQYEVTEENLQFIKGKILFQKSSFKNSFTNHMHYVEYEEFTVNTVLNRIFKTIFLRLLYSTKINSNKVKIKLALTYLEDVDTINLSKEVFNCVRFNRLNIKYEPLFNLSKMFYYNNQPGFKSGDENTFNFLVPLNKLFEFYLFKVLQESEVIIGGKECRTNYQKPQQYLGEYENSGIFLLMPDITLMEDKKVKVILDAKYKRLAERENSFVKQGDIYQMVAYAGHYDCKEILLVYPLYKGEKLREEPIIFKIKIFNNELIIKIIQVDIMEKSVEKVREKLLKDI